MSNELTTPLLQLIRRAAESRVEGPAARMKKRFTNASDEILVLCDCSGSMLDTIGDCNLSKFEHLEIALKDVLQYCPKVRVIGFASSAREIGTSDKLPNPYGHGSLGGGTNLGGALEFAAKFQPRKTIIISDGLPDSEENALDAADKLTGAIDTIYCGPDQHPATAFLRKLARSTGGTAATWEGYHQLAAGIRALLPAPESKAA